MAQELGFMKSMSQKLGFGKGTMSPLQVASETASKRLDCVCQELERMDPKDPRFLQLQKARTELQAYLEDCAKKINAQ
jgi:hypothetical protein